MKQASITTDSLVLSYRRHHSIGQIKTLSKYLLILLLVCFAMLISSCQKEYTQRQDQLSSSQKQNVQVSVPFKAKLTLSLQNDPIITGTGEGSQIGRFTIVAEDDESNFPVITGTVTLTAANGDQIFSTHTGHVEDLGNGILKVTFEETITGGTGRFAEATGNFTNIAIADTNTGTATATFNGTIKY